MLAMWWALELDEVVSTSNAKGGLDNLGSPLNIFTLDIQSTSTFNILRVLLAVFPQTAFHWTKDTSHKLPRVDFHCSAELNKHTWT